MNKALAVFNINAGRKKALKYKKLLLSFLRQNYDEYKIINVDELKQIDSTEYNPIIAIGGDGTVNKVLPHIVHTDKTLGIIPCGTANLLAAKLNIPENIKKALDIIKTNSSTKIDITTINQKISALRIGFGYDSDIICKTPQSMKNKFGYFSYFIAGLLFALRLKNKFYTLEIDGEKKKIKASCVIIANAANMYRNLVSVGVNDKINDGFLDIFILKTQNPILFFVEILKIIFNIKNTNKNVSYFKAKSICMKNKWRYLHIDGEKTKFNSDIEINIMQNAINVFVAQTSLMKTKNQLANTKEKVLQ